VILHGDWRDLAATVGEVDALITDAPYSERVHSGHDRQVSQLEAAGVTDMRRSINYAAWDHRDVRAFVDVWHPKTRGWFVTITDHVLAADWEYVLRAVGRYVFTPLPFFAPGSRVRMAGDGPSNWTTWIVVARPRNKAMASWGTLPGGYVLPPGQGGSLPVVGGKPLWLMEQLVSHYSRPGDLVCDPCCGAGTTLVAALRQGRRAVGSDALKAHADLAMLWTANPDRDAPAGKAGVSDSKQPLLFAPVGA